MNRTSKTYVEFLELVVLSLMAKRKDSDKIEGTQYTCQTVKDLIQVVRDTDLLS
jgi:hypothetical protein